jgi:hypothetical protein
MKRTPLRRRTPLRARSLRRCARRSPAKPSGYKSRERHTPYMLWVKCLPCLMCGVWGTCEGAIEADHAGRRGAARKAHDSTCIPLCRYHHGASRFPRSWPQAQRRAWLHAAVVYTQACARAAGMDVPTDPNPWTEYPATAVGAARLALAAIAVAPLVGISGHLQEVVGSPVEPPLARRNQRRIHGSDRVGAGEGQQPGPPEVIEQLAPLRVGEVNAGDTGQEHLAITEVDAAHAGIGKDPVSEVAERSARAHGQSCSSRLAVYQS